MLMVNDSAWSQWCLSGGAGVGGVARPSCHPTWNTALTPLGEEVAEQVESLASWIEHNLPRIMQARPDQMPVGARLAREER